MAVGDGFVGLRGRGLSGEPLWFDAQRDDPEFGCQFMADEAADTGESMARGPRGGSAWLVNGWSSQLRKKPAPATAPRSGHRVHDDLGEREFTADAPNRLWLADIS